MADLVQPLWHLAPVEKSMESIASVKSANFDFCILKRWIKFDKLVLKVKSLNDKIDASCGHAQKGPQAETLRLYNICLCAVNINLYELF